MEWEKQLFNLIKKSAYDRIEKKKFCKNENERSPEDKICGK